MEHPHRSSHMFGEPANAIQSQNRVDCCLLFEACIEGKCTGRHAADLPMLRRTWSGILSWCSLGLLVLDTHGKTIQPAQERYEVALVYLCGCCCSYSPEFLTDCVKSASR